MIYFLYLYTDYRSFKPETDDMMYVCMSFVENLTTFLKIRPDVQNSNFKFTLHATKGSTRGLLKSRLCANKGAAPMLGTAKAFRTMEVTKS